MSKSFAKVIDRVEQVEKFEKLTELTKLTKLRPFYSHPTHFLLPTAFQVPSQIIHCLSTLISLQFTVNCKLKINDDWMQNETVNCPTKQGIKSRE